MMIASLGCARPGINQDECDDSWRGEERRGEEKENAFSPLSLPSLSDCNQYFSREVLNKQLTKSASNLRFYEANSE